MISNPIKRDFSKNQIKILKLLFEKEYLQNELQVALNTTAPNLHYHLSRLEGYNLIIKETLHEIGSAKINNISLNPSNREYVQKLLGYKNKKSTRNNSSKFSTSSYKTPRSTLNKLKNKNYRISIAIFLLCLTGIVVSSTLLLFIPPKISNENLGSQELTTNADADVFTQKTKTSDISVYDGTGSTPFLRLGLYEYSYDEGGYLSEIYLRFNLPDIERISSMILHLSYWEGYPIEADNYYKVNVSLVSNNWVEGNTVWTERPEELGTSSVIYLHNPSLQSEIILDLTSLLEGITGSLISIRLCPYSLSEIRFPAPFKSSETAVITPSLILECRTSSQTMVPNTAHIILIILLIIFCSIMAINLLALIYRRNKHKFREIPYVVMQDSAVPVISQQKQVSIAKKEISEPAKLLEERRIKQDLCPHCGTTNLKGWKFCTTCGKYIKPKKDSIDTFEFLGGFIISLIGGLTSIALGFGIPFVYPELVYYMEDVMLILQTFMIIGGIVSIVGAILVFFNPKLGGVIVLVGSFIAGLNIISIIGASRILKKIRD